MEDLLLSVSNQVKARSLIRVEGREHPFVLANENAGSAGDPFVATGRDDESTARPIPSIPYVPNPYDDEVLGSWIARAQHFNGSGVWRRLFEDAGYGPKQQSPLFDMVDFEPRLERILTCLGTTYEVALSERTTALYWCSLFASETHRLPGAASLPMPVLNNGMGVRSLNSLGIRRRLGISQRRWHCSKCIEEDVDSQRMPYWRRTHQLPTVHYCHRHLVPLESQCQKCGASTSPASRGGVGLLSVQCECKADRRKDRETLRGPVPNVFKRLCQFSAETLASPKIQQPWRSVLRDIRTRLDARPDLSGQSFLAVLERAFPQTRWENASLIVPVPSTTRFLRFSRPTAEMCAALFAALDGPTDMGVDRSLKTGRSFSRTSPMAKKSVRRAPRNEPKTPASRGQRDLELALTRSPKILEAMQDCLSTSGRPQLVTYGLLGQRVGLTYRQVVESFKADPGLRAVLEYANSIYDERRIRWATYELEKKGGSLRCCAVLNESGVQRTASNVQLTKAVLENREQFFFGMAGKTTG